MGSTVRMENNGATCRFYFGDQTDHYIEVHPTFDYADGRAKLDVRGGSVRGIVVEPLSGNHLQIDFKGDR